ncbi:putrescine transport ATP-binding protein PotA [Halarchaeum acidiphilum MH1-52-1]|uniref:Molybdate/tungstate import ATP-binding protein WtpC n=2 Tax=Halarchaeum acidiphilum TaxID=489138 RepID=U2YDT8_9EURY|nr:putrescine transport ATP-binding protein PotA [Halarchaeum acidiphilum MH1-52-1]
MRASKTPTMSSSSSINADEATDEGHGSVVIEDLRKEFDDVTAVDGLSLEIEAEEFLTLLGPSGCGKSTTLRLISGLETATSGTIKINGEDVTDIPANKRNTSMVFQEWALFPHMTVQENIAFGLEMRDVPKAEREERIEHALELIELPGYQDRKVSQLSGGQKQRIAMARSIVLEPDVLLFDEPLSSLDRSLRQTMQIELKNMQEELGITFIYVTHDQEEALTMSNRVAVMNDGHLEQVGETYELYEHPQSEFVANFVGETNFFTGVVSEIDVKTLVIDAEEGDIRVESEKTDQLSVGDSVHLTVRPEDIEIADSLDTPNRWECTIGDVVYKGSFIQYDVDVGDRTFLVEQQMRKTTTPRERGDSVDVGFSVEAGEVILDR